MEISDWLGIALIIIGILVGLAALYAIRVLVLATGTILADLEEVRGKLVPLLEKADVTVDAVNAEILRIDAIVSQAEEVGDAVSTASDFIRSPVSSAAQGIARIARAFGRR